MPEGQHVSSASLSLHNSPLNAGGGLQVVHRLVALGWLEDAVGLLGLQPVWWHANAADRNENMRALVRGLASSFITWAVVG